MASSFSSSNTDSNDGTVNVEDHTHVPLSSSPSEHTIFNWDGGAFSADTLKPRDLFLSTFSSLPSSSAANSNDDSCDPDVEIERSKDNFNLYYHSDEFLETVTLRDPSAFNDSCPQRSPIRLTCTFDGVNFHPSRVKFNPKYERHDISSVSDASSSKIASASVSDNKTATFGSSVTENIHDSDRGPQATANEHLHLPPQQVPQSLHGKQAAIARTPQELLRIHRVLETLGNKADRPFELAELADLTKPQEVVWQLFHENDAQNVLDDLLRLAVEHKAETPQNTVDALPPSAFLKQSVTVALPTSPPIIIVDDEPIIPIVSANTQREAMVEDENTTHNVGEGDHGLVDSGHWESEHGASDFTDIQVEQASSLQISYFTTPVDYVINDTQDNFLTAPSTQAVVDVHNGGRYPYNNQPLIQSYSGQIQTEGINDVPNFEYYPSNQPSSFGGYVGNNGNVPQQVPFLEQSYHITHLETANYTATNTTDWENNNDCNSAVYNDYNAENLGYTCNDGNVPEHVQFSGLSHHAPHPEMLTHTNFETNSGWQNDDSHNPAYNYNDHNTTWSLQQNGNTQTSHEVHENNNSNNVIPTMYSTHPQGHNVPCATGEPPRYFPFSQFPASHSSHTAPHNALYPIVHDTFHTSQMLQKRKREEDGENRIQYSEMAPPPLKRQMLANTPSSTASDIQLTLPSLGSLPLHDRRRKEPYTKLLDQDYICEYPVGDNETCQVKITLDRRGQGERNWKRHLTTHAKKEEQMLRDGVIDTNSEKVYALLWVEKISVVCPEPGCQFSTKVWRTDGVLDDHLAQFHHTRYVEKMERQRQLKRKGKGKEKENG